MLVEHGLQRHRIEHLVDAFVQPAPYVSGGAARTTGRNAVDDLHIVFKGTRDVAHRDSGGLAREFITARYPAHGRDDPVARKHAHDLFDIFPRNGDLALQRGRAHALVGIIAGENITRLQSVLRL